MLRKSLKYDFKSILKFWWIIALISIAFSLIGSTFIFILNSELALPDFIEVMAGFSLFFIFMALTLLTLITFILIFARFYKNFFSDEGYLTFTLPVKRIHLLNSKLIMSTVMTIATYVLIVFDILLMLVIPFASEVFSKHFWDGFKEMFSVFYKDLGIFLFIYPLEILVILLLMVVFSNLFLFCCISFGCTIVKRGKIFAAIGIYYGANSIVSTIIQIFYTFGIGSLAQWLSPIPDNAFALVIALLLLGIIFFIAIFCAILYALQYFMMDRKLNLS